jgi:hypothetical protein
MDVDDIRGRAATAKRNAASLKAYKEWKESEATKLPNPSEYEKNREAYTAYLLMCVRLGDWHGVSDAANDLRVLEAKEGK